MHAGGAFDVSTDALGIFFGEREGGKGVLRVMICGGRSQVRVRDR